eukprot:GHVN01075754.1.p1 GENE.GHVN01075754.1~~GHVN01075754.1.p1  ORF type:complete len:556 (-),score=154.18 GHVN01075754.1:517-2184(-)
MTTQCVWNPLTGVGSQNAHFTSKALLESSLRMDGRGLFDLRPLSVEYLHDYGRVIVSLGDTRVLGVVTGEVVTPHTDRPNDGFTSFNVDFGPMASPAFEVGRQHEVGVEVGVMLERMLKGSRSLDTEALCILAGVKVWSLRVDLRALNDSGNLVDACGIAALAAIKHFRKQDVTVCGAEAVVHNTRERNPVPLSLHHSPVQVSFAHFSKDCFLVDPSLAEEDIMLGRLTVSVNYHGQLCGLHKPGGVPLSIAQIKECVDHASSIAKQVIGVVDAAVVEDERVRERRMKDLKKWDRGTPLSCEPQLGAWYRNKLNSGLRDPPAERGEAQSIHSDEDEMNQRGEIEARLRTEVRLICEQTNVVTQGPRVPAHVPAHTEHTVREVMNPPSEANKGEGNGRGERSAAGRAEIVETQINSQFGDASDDYDPMTVEPSETETSHHSVNGSKIIHISQSHHSPRSSHLSRSPRSPKVLLKESETQQTRGDRQLSVGRVGDEVMKTESFQDVAGEGMTWGGEGEVSEVGVKQEAGEGEMDEEVSLASGVMKSKKKKKGVKAKV